MVQKKARAQDYTPEERLAIITEGMAKRRTSHRHRVSIPHR